MKFSFSSESSSLSQILSIEVNFSVLLFLNFNFSLEISSESSFLTFSSDTLFSIGISILFSFFIRISVLLFFSNFISDSIFSILGIPEESSFLTSSNSLFSVWISWVFSFSIFSSCFIISIGISWLFWFVFSNCFFFSFDSFFSIISLLISFLLTSLIFCPNKFLLIKLTVFLTVFNFSPILVLFSIFNKLVSELENWLFLLALKVTFSRLFSDFCCWLS